MRNTKQLIADTFIHMVSEQSLSRVRIADLIDVLDINRNTFYYYFSNKYDVSMWVFRKDLATELSKSFDEEELVFSTLDGDNADQKKYPFYVHVEIGARTLDYSGFLKALATCTDQRQSFYSKLFTVREQEFITCLSNLFYPAIERDLDFILNGRYMPDVTRKVLCTMGVHHIFEVANLYLESGCNHSLLDDRVNPFWNIFQEALHDAIQSHPINRYIDLSRTIPNPFEIV